MSDGTEYRGFIEAIDALLDCAEYVSEVMPGELGKKRE